MIGIHSIGCYVPTNYIDNLDRCGQFEKEKSFIKEKIGFLRLPRNQKNIETSDMCVASFEALSKKTVIDKELIDCMIVCTQNPDGYGLPHTSSLVHDKLNLPKNVAAFDVSLGCSGYVYCLNIIINFMSGNSFRNGLLFTADPYSKIIDRNDYTTELIFGDAATCSFITDDPTYIIGKTIFGTDGSNYKAIIRDTNTSKISMNGRSVFNFTMRKIPEQIKKCLTENEITIENVDLLLLHQGSKYIIKNLRNKLGVTKEKAPFLAKYYGNTISSTIPLMLRKYIEKGPPIILASGFGVGLSCASTILKRRN